MGYDPLANLSGAIILAADNTHVLDNPAWHSLTTHHAHFAIGDSLALRYPADVSPFVATADLSTAALHDLAEIAAPGEIVGMIGEALPSDAAGWTLVSRFSVIQMISEQPSAEVETTESILDLNAGDVPEMLDLIHLTEPGPFAARTIELGHYIGIRKEGRLVAMAGERLYPPGYREISAVCTHPDYQGKGYAGLLVSRLTVENWQRGDIPFLHVSPTNERARKVYERLHFRIRSEAPLLVISH